MSRYGFTSRLSQREPELSDSRAAAAEFYQLNRVPEEIERALNDLFLHRPGDLHGYLANYFANISATPRINRLRAWEVFDTRGQLSMEVEVCCIVCNKEKSTYSAAVSGHFGLKDTSEDWEALCQERADHVMAAVQWISEPLNNILQGLNPLDQSEVDTVLSDFFMARYLDKKDNRNTEREQNSSPSRSEGVLPPILSTLTKEKKNNDKAKRSNLVDKQLPPAEPPEPILPGSLAIGSVSLAVARTGAKLQDIPLYKYIAALKGREIPAQFHVPIPLLTLLSCGKDSPGKLSLLEEVILIPQAGQRVKQIITMTLELQKEMMRITKSEATVVHDSGAPVMSFERTEQPLDLIAEACTNLGLELGTEVNLALNCAACELMYYSKGKYEVAAGYLKSPDELVDMYQSFIEKYPAVVALIDPFRKEDKAQWEKLSNVMGDSCSLLFNIASGLKVPAIPGVRGHILKHILETTVSDLVRVTSEHQGSVLMGTTNSETCSNDSLSDIAVGLGLDYVKLGGLSGAERMTTCNRLISIEEELAQQGILVSKEKHSPLLYTKKQQKQPAAEESAPSDEA